jgi:hypothetical protein
MDRINGADTVDIGGGRRGFRDENLVAGVPGTEVTASFLNGLQEEVLQVVTQAGLVPSNGDWTQLWQALQILGLSTGGKSRRWLSVLSMTLSSAPGSPSVGDAYLIPGGASGIWAANAGKIAEWTGASWSYLATPNGHGFSLPDGRIFEKINGAYTELLASDTRSGLVELATIPEAKAGTDNERAVTPAGLAATIADITPPRPNLCPNGGFELGLSAVDVSKAGVAWPARLVEDGWGRSLSLNTPLSDGTYIIMWPQFPVAAGASYTISGDAVLFAASGTVKFDLAWYDASGTLLSYSASKSRGTGDFNDSAAARQSMAVSVVAPASAISARLRCVFENVTSPTALSARLAKVEKGGLPATAYVPTPSQRRHAVQVYNTAGTYTWTAPVTGWYQVRLYGGGGGGALNSGMAHAEGGGGGGYAMRWLFLIAGTAVPVTVGVAGSSNGSGTANGASGGTTSFGAYFSATGGGGGTYTALPGVGGQGIGGDINLTGQGGQDGSAYHKDGIGGDAAGPEGGKASSISVPATWPGGGGTIISNGNGTYDVKDGAVGGIIIEY